MRHVARFLYMWAGRVTLKIHAAVAALLVRATRGAAVALKINATMVVSLSRVAQPQNLINPANQSCKSSRIGVYGGSCCLETSL